MIVVLYEWKKVMDSLKTKCIFVVNTCKMFISLLTCVKRAINKDRNKSTCSG